MAGWSKLTQPQLRVLLRSHGQPTDGSKTALVQRLAAFLSDAAASEEAADDDGVGELVAPLTTGTAGEEVF